MTTHPRETLSQIASDPHRATALHDVVGDFCHSLRNRLNSLHMSMYIARNGEAEQRSPLWDDVEQHYRAVEGTIELFQSVCRPVRLMPIEIDLSLIVSEFASRWSGRFSNQGLNFSSEVGQSDGKTCVDPSRLAMGLDAIAAWRLDRAKPGSRISLNGSVEQGWSMIEWSEEVIPSPEEEGELALAALCRTISLHGGKMTRDVSSGWRIQLDWPNELTYSA